jgi:acetyltransferase-like isoleucine patch superfamily enzyme
MLERIQDFWLQKFVCRNDTVRFARYLGVTVGEGCRMFDNPRHVFGSEPYLVKLGDHVTIASGVRFITHDGGVWVFRKEHPEIDLFGNIVVGNNVFIGFNVIILPNVTIGDNCVLGAGSIVTRDIPSNVVAVGNPAKVLRTLDDYWRKVQPVALHVRNLAPETKRDAIVKHAKSNPEKPSID